MAAKLSALSAGSGLTYRENHDTRSVNTEDIVRLEGLGTFEKIKKRHRNRTRDLPACNTVPQATTPPCALLVISNYNSNAIILKYCTFGRYER
jgi:hypothetical protein